MVTMMEVQQVCLGKGFVHKGPLELVAIEISQVEGDEEGEDIQMESFVGGKVVVQDVHCGLMEMIL